MFNISRVIYMQTAIGHPKGTKMYLYVNVYNFRNTLIKSGKVTIKQLRSV